jgi:hypothetical protein
MLPLWVGFHPWRLPLHHHVLLHSLLPSLPLTSVFPYICTQNSDWPSNLALAQSVPNRWWTYCVRDHPVVPLRHATSPPYLSSLSPFPPCRPLPSFPVLPPAVPRVPSAYPLSPSFHRRRHFTGRVRLPGSLSITISDCDIRLPHPRVTVTLSFSDGISTEPKSEHPHLPLSQNHSQANSTPRAPSRF